MEHMLKIKAHLVAAQQQFTKGRRLSKLYRDYQIYKLKR